MHATQRAVPVDIMADWDTGASMGAQDPILPREPLFGRLAPYCSFSASAAHAGAPLSYEYEKPLQEHEPQRI